jgi:hypothetical protein
VDMAAGRSHHHTQKAPVPPSGFGPGVRHEPLTSCAPARGNHPGSAGRRTGQPPWRPPRRGRCGNNTSGRQARIRVDCEVCEVAFARGGHRRTSSPRGLLRPRPPGSFFSLARSQRVRAPYQIHSARQRHASAPTRHQSAKNKKETERDRSTTATPSSATRRC